MDGEVRGEECSTKHDYFFPRMHLFFVARDRLSVVQAAPCPLLRSTGRPISDAAVCTVVPCDGSRGGGPLPSTGHCICHHPSLEEPTNDFGAWE